jgi:hypothetical protein
MAFEMNVFVVNDKLVKSENRNFSLATLRRTAWLGHAMVDVLN